ncbi:MAG: peptidylprolyl isomerase [Cytophagales bacterium]
MFNIAFVNSANCQAPTNGIVLDKVIAKVDNHILLKSEYDVAYLQAIQNDKDFDFKISGCKVLEQVLTNKLLLAKADLDSVVVDDKVIENEMNRRMEYFISQIGSKEKLEAYYNKSVNALKADLRRQVKEQMVIQKMQDNITGKTKVTPGEVKKFFSEIPTDSLPLIPRELEIGHIVKLPIVNRDQKKQTREKLERIRKLIVDDGESFQKLAKEYSEDPGSASRNGELGYFKKGDLVPEYEAASMKLKVGDISPVIESMFGFHIIQLIERRGNEYNTRHILLKPISSEADVESSARFLDTLKNKIVKDSISFPKAAKENTDDKATKETGGMLMDQQGSTKMAAENIDPALYLMLDTMKVGSISKPIPYRTEDGKDAYRIVYLKSVTPPHQANLKDDYQKIQASSIQVKKNKLINGWFNKVKSEVFLDIDPEYKDCEILKGLN